MYKQVLDKVLTQQVVLSTVPKREVMIVLPYLSKLLLQIHTRINPVIKKKLPHFNFRIVFQSKCKLINFFTFKDKTRISLCSSTFYKFKCRGCNATYYGKTKRHFKVIMCEHLGLSALSGKRMRANNDSAVKEHHLFCNHSSGFDDFSILASNNNEFDRDHPPLNKNRNPLPFELFDD